MRITTNITLQNNRYSGRGNYADRDLGIPTTLKSEKQKVTITDRPGGSFAAQPRSTFLCTGQAN